MRNPTLTLCFFLAGCNTPLSPQDLAGLAPWERLPDGDGITYIAKARGGRQRIPTLAALVQYSDDHALRLIVNEFGLIAAKVENAQAVTLFEIDNEQIALSNVSERYEYPQLEDGYSCSLWVDTQNKRAIIQRMWWW